MELIQEWLGQWHPVTQALFATLFTWGVTALGAALVFFFKEINQPVPVFIQANIRLFMKRL